MTGFVDAIAFDRTGVFVANMTGNTVLAGIGLGEGSASLTLLPLLAIAAFLAGSVAAALLRRGARDSRTTRVRLLGGEAILLAGVVAAVLIQGGRGASWRGDALVIVLGSLAMALQTQTVRSVGGVLMSTTFDTGMVAALGASLATRAAKPAAVLGTLLLLYAAGAAVGGLVVATGARAAGLAVPLVILGVLVAVIRARAPREPTSG